MKRIIAFILVMLLVLSMISCGGDVVESSSSTTPSSSDTSTTDSSKNDDTNDKDDEDEEIVFRVYLEYNGEAFTSSSDVPIVVTWSDGISYVNANVDKDGMASVIGLDGDYDVTLKNLPEGYTYNPNIYRATNDTPEIVIDIYKLGTSKGSGTGVYSPNRKVLTKTSMYRATLTSDNQKIYFEFAPKASGTYTIESWLPITDDKINPKIDVYSSNSAAPMFQYTLDSGGAEGKNYTKNFKYEVYIADEMISLSGGQVVFIFAIYTTARNDKYYPVNVDFAVQYEGGFEINRPDSNYVMPEQMYAKMGEVVKEMKSLSRDEFMSKYSVSGYEEYYGEAYADIQRLTNLDLEDAISLNVLFNAHPFIRSIASAHYKSYLNGYYDDIEGKTWQNPSTVINGRTVFIGTNYKFNDNTGFYHKYDETKYASDPYGYGEGFGPILYADISTAARTGVLDTAFIAIEYIGNKALLVSNGTEYYKLFIEGYENVQSMSLSTYGGEMDIPEELKNTYGYNDFVNKDGAVPVNREVHDFLQKYSVSQVLFMDGDGWAETGTIPYESTEDDQWLFACGYYE